MHAFLHISCQVTKSVVLIMALGFAAASAFGQWLEVTPVSIFGDGDPLNGIEDDRQRVGRQGGRYGR